MLLLQLLLLPVLALALPVTNTTNFSDISTDPSDTTTDPADTLPEISTNMLISQSKAVVTNKPGLAFYNANLNSGNAGYADPGTTYNCYSGPASNFPAMSKWMSFNNMWKLMQRDALTPIGDTVKEQAMMLKAIKQVSTQAKVDARVILAVIIGESTGNVRVGCTNNGVQNCGLMQSHNPKLTAFNPNKPQASITQMVRDGTQGTPSGPGLVQLFNNDQLTNGNLWNVLRAYNSGSVDYENLSDAVGATAAYVSNMANFLQGWNGWGNGPADCGF